ncbi:MAG: NAD-dependent epimerase/dehydratase family protein [Nitrospinae bacterium]|nr:NAD-dependent epimerase/dehydratase family protein [Nitrospinota bacterium]
MESSRNSHAETTTRTLLVTGASSELGSSLIRRLSGSPGWDIRAMVHRSLVNVPGCEMRPGNLSDVGLLARAASGVDTVIHLAALTNSPREAEYFETNVTGTRNLIDACVQGGVRRIIFISSRTASVDGGSYARSKLEAEEIVKASGLRWVILRPAEVYGTGSGGSVNRLAAWVQRYPMIPVIGDGGSRLSPVYIDDVVSAMAQVVLDEKLENETIVLSGPDELTFDELVDRMAGFFGVRRFKLHLPVGLVKLAATILSGLGIHVLVPDQIPRLLGEKPHGIEQARKKLNYSPRKLEDGLNELFQSGQ